MCSRSDKIKHKNQLRIDSVFLIFDIITYSGKTNLFCHQEAINMDAPILYINCKKEQKRSMRLTI